MGLFRRLRNLIRRKELDRDLERELAFHINERTDALMESGLSQDDARREALRQFGNYTVQKERTRDMDIYGWLESVAQDVRYGGRMIRKSPAFTLVVVLSLAIGIGANSTLFSLVDAILFRPLSLDHVNEVVYFEWATRSNWLALGLIGTTNMDPNTKEMTSTSFSYPMFQSIRERSQTLSDVFSYAPLFSVTVSVDGQPDIIPGQMVSGNYFSALRVPVAAGRMITDDDDRQSSPVAVISYRFWQRRFDLKPDALGKTIIVNGVPLTIIGVTSAGFAGIQGFGMPTDISVPLRLEPQIPATGNPGSRLAEGWRWWVRILGRMKPNVTDAHVRNELETVFQNEAFAAWNGSPNRPKDADPNREMPKLRVRSAARGLTDNFDRPGQLLTPLAVIAGILLLIVCANIANLMLARSSARRAELSVRLAIGGSRVRLVRQLLTETLLLSLIGGLFGAILAYWGKDLLIGFFPQTPESAYDLRIDPRVVLFTAVISIGVGIITGIMPSLRTTGRIIHPNLKDSSRALLGHRTRLNKTLLIVQVALSIVLLVGAGMFVRTVRNLRSVDVGFDPDNLLLFKIAPRPLKYSNARIEDLYQQTLMKVAALPGVRDVSLTEYPLVGRSGDTDTIYVEGMEQNADRSNRTANILRVHPNLFQVLGVTVLSGRDLSVADNGNAPKVALINETLASRLFGNENPLGTRVAIGRPVSRSDQNSVIEIVGVVKDVAIRGTRQALRPAIIIPYSQSLPGSVTFMARTLTDPLTLAPAVREAVREIDSNVPVSDIKTQREQINGGFPVEEIFANCAAFFGAITLILACIGLFGLMSYSVERRINEIGVRMALGARRMDVVHLIMRQTLTLVFAGIIVGSAGSWGIGKALSSMNVLFKVTPNDPVSFAVAVFTMVGVACFAAYLPARRASRVDPSSALRSE